MGQLDQAIGLAAHGRNHHHHGVTVIAEPGDLVGHLPYALDIGYRGSTKFLNNQTHEYSRCRQRPRIAHQQKGALLNTKVDNI
jgi:hypothetical protein